MSQPPSDRRARFQRPGWGYLLLAGAMLCGAVWLLLDAAATGTATRGELQVQPPPGPASALSVPAPFTPTPALAASRAQERGPTQPTTTAANPLAPTQASDDLAAHVPPGQLPTMNEVIDRLHQAGIRTGLGAFNPPGTRPPLVGLAVPEGFDLPPGYLRHHQATDDGQPIEAILMFDPDHPPAVAAGRNLNTPTDRVVPAALAPAGLPLRMITVPPPVDAGGARR